MKSPPQLVDIGKLLGLAVVPIGGGVAGNGNNRDDGTGEGGESGNKVWRKAVVDQSVGELGGRMGKCRRHRIVAKIAPEVDIQKGIRTKHVGFVHTRIPAVERDFGEGTRVTRRTAGRLVVIGDPAEHAVVRSEAFIDASGITVLAQQAPGCIVQIASGNGWTRWGK